MIWPAGLVITLAAAVLGGGGGGGRVEPAPLRGAALEAKSGLRLLVADGPPFVLDVDSGSITRVRGVGSSNSSIVDVAGRAGVVHTDDVAFAVGGRPPRSSRLGAALAVVPAPEGRSVWLKSRTGRGCALREIPLAGTRAHPARAFPCAWTIAPGGSLGIVARRTQLLDPRTGRTVSRTRWGILAAVGDKLVLKGPGRQLALVDARSGNERSLAWPSILNWIDHAPAVDPRGRYAALGFANPAWSGEDGNTVGQVLDVWLLDTRTAELTQIPGFPAFVGLKVTSMEWTNDGRLVVFGEDDRRGFVAVWRPGELDLSLKRVKLPRRSGYSDSFAVLR